MSASEKNCCVPKCGRTRADDAILHLFPNPEKDIDRFMAWVQAVGDTLSDLDHQYIFKNRRICHSHFESKYLTWRDRLSRNAVPTLLMPGPSVSRAPMMDITNTASTSSGPSVERAPMMDITNTASTSSGFRLVEVPDVMMMDVSNSNEKPSENLLMNAPKGESSVSRKHLITDNKILQKTVHKLLKKNDTYRTRLNKALKLSENKTFQNVLKKFTTLAALFTVMQFREIGKKKMGRRFTEKEKLMALSLYKRGPRAYRWLQTVFVLPSPVTLSRVIAKANLRPGINANIFIQLKKRVKKMKEDEKACILLFDEMSIEPHFEFNLRKDSISGFVNNGKKKEKNIANHALVFMIRGILKNYKQPVAYTFCAGSTKKLQLAAIMKEVISNLQNAGLHVLATVCDQGKSNVSAINQLIRETRAQYLKKNEELRRDVFEVNGQEIIPLFDVPHLMKGIRNNLIDKDLKCKIDGEEKIAKWTHIIKLYENDPAYKGLRLSNKLTVQHIKPNHFDKMKVKYATQALSEKVAVAMGFLADGPQGSLRRLRNQLAEDGCAESQVVLAKQLLEEKCELETDKINNFKQALEWLICATEQAHPEARRMLKRCIRSGVIDEHSSAIIRAKSCLAASRQETVARKAARDLFASLSNGEQYITTAQLERRIREISSSIRDHGDDSDAPDDDAPDEDERLMGEGGALEASPEGGDTVHGNGTIRPSDDSDGEYSDTCNTSDDIRNLTVDNLVSAAVDYCQGELPLVSYELTLTDPSTKCLDHIPLLHQAFLHPIVFIQVLYLKLLYYFGNFTFRLSNIELALVLVAYLSVNTDSLSHLVPLVLYYVSFAAMVVCTFKMLHAKRQFIDFRKWSGLFLRYSDGNLHPDESENLFVRNNLGPFIQFFVSLLINLFLYPFIATQWVPFSEFCVLSFFLMFTTLLSFGDGSCPDVLAFLSFGINVLAKYPYEKDTVVHQGWRFLDLQISNYPSYILGNSIEFCLNARVFFSLLTPLIIISMAKRHNWQGFFKYALPHCVTISWLQMFITCSHGCTTYGLIRGTLGLVCTFLFLPLIGVATATLPIFACLQYMTLSRLVYTMSVLAGLAFTLGGTCLMAKSETTKKYVTPFQLALGLVTLIYFGNQFVINVQDDGLPSTLIDLIGDDKSTLKNLLKNDFITDFDDNTYHIGWEDYYSHCHTPSWAGSNMASTQIKCAVLEGANVHWEGYIKEVKLRIVKNNWNEFSKWLPNMLREYFKCYYGEDYASLCDDDGDPECEFVRGVARQSGKSCHLNNLNEYTYELTVMMEASGGLLKRHSEINLIFDHNFSNFTKVLRTDDKIRFKGVLINDSTFNIGSKDMKIKGYEIACVDCKEAQGAIRSKVPSASKFSELFKTIANDCIVSTKYILNFLFNPIVVFK